MLGLSRLAARERALELLRVVGIPDPARRYDSYPHELSGGLRQHVMIAIALSSEPAILLCDEPTTALDVTIRAQILALLSDLRTSSGLSIIFVTHDLGVVGQVCDDLAVMYALDVDAADTEPVAIPGAVPDPMRPLPGCSFQPRCPLAESDCKAAPVPLRIIAPGRCTACLHYERLASDSGAAWSHG